jgi:SAM-dependent methyltransferase
LALKQHFNAEVTFRQQSENSRQYVVPFIEQTKPIGRGTAVLEIGTAEGGVLLPFLERDCRCVGVDLAEHRVEDAKRLLAEYIATGKAEIRCQNIYEQAFLNDFRYQFDIIILKDVIEHVPEQENFIAYLKNLLKPGGQIFFGFPPWYMPFGGHQQICRKKWAAMLPWYHLLPRFMFRGILKMAGEAPVAIKEFMELKDTGITIERFERVVKRCGLKVLRKQHYLINPIYQYKFGLKPRAQFAPIRWIPYVRDFFTTCVYYTVG